MTGIPLGVKHAEIRVGTWLRIQGVSKKGKDRVRKYGSRWYVLEIRTTDSVTALKTNPPYLYVGPGNGHYPRWMSLRDDRHFQIVAILSE